MRRAAGALPSALETKSEPLVFRRPVCSCLSGPAHMISINPAKSVRG
jgi:hypothetical protein